LLSFAAFSRMSPMQRSLALSHTSTTQRLEYAHKCLLKARNRSAAQLAVNDALTTVG
jgi:hypothetical protein